MSGHIGLREDAKVGARLAARIARLFGEGSRPLPGATSKLKHQAIPSK